MNYASDGGVRLQKVRSNPRKVNQVDIKADQTKGLIPNTRSATKPSLPLPLASRLKNTSLKFRRRQRPNHLKIPQMMKH
jgi:hypothetical protein